MKPLILQGHSRPVKHLIFSNDGEILFTASADRSVISWLTSNGDKLLSYSHSASVNTIALSSDGTYLISGDNVGCSYIWNVKGGNLIKKLEHDPVLSVRSLDLFDLSLLMITYAGRTKLAQSCINIYNFNELLEYGNLKVNNNFSNVKNNFYESDSIYSIYSNNNSKNNSSNGSTSTTVPLEKIIPYRHFECSSNTNTKYVCAKFISSVNSFNNIKCALFSREDGSMELINVNNGKLIFENKFHEDSILDFDYNNEKNMVLTSSKDGSALLFNLDTLEAICKYKPENPTRNLNTCKICNFSSFAEIPLEKDEKIGKSGKNDDSIFNSIDVNSIFDSDIVNNNLISITNYVEDKKVNTGNELFICVFAGGQDSKLVTTSKQEGGFDIFGYDCNKNSSPIFSFNSHFGPVYSVAYSKIKNLLASGSEDSSAKIYILDNKLFNI